MSDRKGVKENALALIQAENLLLAGDSVLVAFSGGADSMTLLHLLLSLREELSLGPIAAAHVHHGLRGEEADRDEEAVRAFCEAYKVPLFVCHADVAEEAKRRHCGLEEAGRAVRYEFLRKVAEEERFDRIATAHTLSDSMETVLLHMVRGTGIRGLCGIPAVHGRVIRPLLTCTREEIEIYCRENDLPFVTDSTNFSDRYSRNRVRNEILPVLYSLNPRADEAFARLMRTASLEEAYWQEQAAAVLKEAETGPGVYAAERVFEQPRALRLRVLRQLLLERADGGEERHVLSLERLLSDGGAMTLPGGYGAVVKQGYLTIRKAGADPEKPEPQVLIPEREYDFGGVRYLCRVLDPISFKNAEKIHKNLLKSAFDYDKIQGVAVVRTRLSKDAYHPFRRGGGKSLKKWMNECRIPMGMREEWPVLSDDCGILLVPGLGCDRRVAITPSTQHIFVFFEEDKKG